MFMLIHRLAADLADEGGGVHVAPDVVDVQAAYMYILVTTTIYDCYYH